MSLFAFLSASNLNEISERIRTKPLFDDNMPSKYMYIFFEVQWNVSIMMIVTFCCFLAHIYRHRTLWRLVHDRLLHALYFHLVFPFYFMLAFLSLSFVRLVLLSRRFVEPNNDNNFKNEDKRTAFICICVWSVFCFRIIISCP